MPTKEELEREIERLKEQNRELAEQIHARDAALSHSGEPGWLVTTPSPRYNGVTCGVKFANGRAFVPESVVGAEAAIRELVNDYRYTVKRMTAKEFQELAPVKVTERKPTLAEQLMQPDVVTG